jgi:hypothetical protein
METMTFYRALEAMITRDVAMRRKGWHNGICYVYIDRTKGFTEPFVVKKNHTEAIAWPYAAQRGDWCAEDWYQLTDKQRDAYHETPQNPKVEATAKITPKLKKPRTTKAAAPPTKPPKPARSPRPKAGTS